MSDGVPDLRGAQSAQQAVREGVARAEARSGLQASQQLESGGPSIGGIALAATALAIVVAAVALVLNAVGVF